MPSSWYGPKPEGVYAGQQWGNAEGWGKGWDGYTAAAPPSHDKGGKGKDRGHAYKGGKGQDKGKQKGKEASAWQGDSWSSGYWDAGSGHRTMEVEAWWCGGCGTQNVVQSKQCTRCKQKKSFSTVPSGTTTPTKKPERDNWADYDTDAATAWGHDTAGQADGSWASGPTPATASDVPSTTLAAPAAKGQGQKGAHTGFDDRQRWGEEMHDLMVTEPPNATPT